MNLKTLKSYYDQVRGEVDKPFTAGILYYACTEETHLSSLLQFVMEAALIALLNDREPLTLLSNWKMNEHLLDNQYKILEIVSLVAQSPVTAIIDATMRDNDMVLLKGERCIGLRINEKTAIQLYTPQEAGK